MTMKTALKIHTYRDPKEVTVNCGAPGNGPPYYEIYEKFDGSYIGLVEVQDLAKLIEW
jgi:hypothetical protein